MATVKPTISASSIIQDTTHRFVSDVEKGKWNSSGYNGNPAIIAQDPTHRFVSDVEKGKWNAGGYNGDPAIIVQDPTHRFVTDTEKAAWSAGSTGSTGSTNPNYVNVKDYGAVGDNVKDDTSAIQNALNSGFDVYMPAGGYKTTATLVTNPGQTLRMSSKAVIYPNTNNHVIQVRIGCHIFGGKIDCSYPAVFNHAAIFLDSADRFYTWPQTAVEDVSISGNPSHTPVGILIQADAAEKLCSFVFFNRIDIRRCDKAIHLLVTSSGSNCFITGNLFGNIIIDTCTHGIYIEAGTGVNSQNIAGNYFTNFQWQQNTGSLDYIYCDGWHNTFQGMTWDLDSNPSCMLARFTSKAQYNTSHFRWDVWGKFIVDQGQNNWYIDKNESTRMIGAPTSGTYTKGSIVWNSSPDPGEYAGWVCTTAGTPGTWHGFGLIV